MKDVVALVLIIIFAICSGLYVLDIYGNPTEERSIVVINKTTEIVSCGFGASTEYLILADDGTVYHARNWKMYYDMKIGERYNVTVKNIYGCRYDSNFWRIEEINEV